MVWDLLLFFGFGVHRAKGLGLIRFRVHGLRLNYRF